MKDPLGIMGAETIFVMEGFAGGNQLEEFENMDFFKAGIARKKYKLPYSYDGTGGVVYGPYLYYNRYERRMSGRIRGARISSIGHGGTGAFLYFALVILVTGLERFEPVLGGLTLIIS